MPYRREATDIRTDRPASAAASAAADEGLPTVGEILSLEAVAAGVPEVLVGGSALDARVRWLHVSDSAGVARLLDGGELLLSTGSGWPAEPAELRALLAGLVEAGIAGLVLELGAHYRYVPAVVVDAATEHGLALAALHREVKFVALTEAVHRRIISEQTAALHARDEVRERFTALALRGAPADHIVQQLARTLGAPVVLENLAHEVVAADLPPEAEEELLGGWQLRSRDAHRRASLGGAAVAAGRSDAWLIVPVEARGIRWGHVIAMPGPAHPAGRTSVLEQGAIALALGRLADGDDDTWARIGRQRLVEHLLTGRFGTAGGASARLESAGFALAGADLYGVVASGRIGDGTVDEAARRLGGRALEGRPQAGGAPASARVLLLSLPAGTRFDDAAARAFAAALAGSDAGSADAAGVALAIGRPAHDLDGLLVSVQEALDLARTPLPPKARGPIVRRSQDRPLVRLVTSLRDDHRLQELGEHMLAPLIEHDLARGGDLLDVLGAMLAHPGNRTAAAQASHLSRSVFYQRLGLIGDLLDVDLDDGETLTALHLALLVRRSATR
ncbi:PucR family transcriptional regulator ligand-binding domain-containing protein [Agromyces sp. NPDC056523]|uniref:PucR family transcriptional regulator n=1 Tax=Agromyces sp. NPDC056523 TaxID=3345850 RepID=UPI00366D2904